MIWVKSCSSFPVHLTMKASWLLKEMSVTDSLCCWGTHLSVWPSWIHCFPPMTAASWVSTLLPLLPVHVVLLEPITFLQEFVTQTQVLGLFHSQDFSGWFSKEHKMQTRPVWIISGTFIGTGGKDVFSKGIAKLRRITSWSCQELYYAECQLDKETKTEERQIEPDRETERDQKLTCSSALKLSHLSTLIVSVIC